MHREVLAVDLPAVVRVATAQNLDIRVARQEVEATRGQLESTVGAAFPALVPTAMFDAVRGTVRATEGDLVGVGFNTFQPAIAAQWVLNPGRVAYETIAARKRLSTSEHLEQAVILETLRTAAVRYYDLVLAQAEVSAAHQAVAEAQELLRISRLRVRTGTGVRADELRAEARLAERQQDLILALNEFYEASVALALTLHLDAAVTLIPSVERLAPTFLIREDVTIEELLDLAVRHRPDLEGVRQLAAAAGADRGATWWGAYGPQFQVAYQYGGITGQADNVVQRGGIPGNLIVNPLSASGSFAASPVANGLIKETIARGSRRLAGKDDRTFGFSDQQRFNAAMGWRLSLAAFGDLKTAAAVEQQAIIEAERRRDQIQAQVVSALQAGKAHSELIAKARQQVTAAQEALRLTESNLQVGTMTTLDVLQAQDAVAQARLRHAEAVVTFNQAQVNLLAAIGLLDADALLASRTEPPATPLPTTDAADN